MARDELERLEDVLRSLKGYADWADETAVSYNRSEDKYGAAWYCSRALAFRQAIEVIESTFATTG